VILKALKSVYNDRFTIEFKKLLGNSRTLHADSYTTSKNDADIPDRSVHVSPFNKCTSQHTGFFAIATILLVLNEKVR